MDWLKSSGLLEHLSGRLYITQVTAFEALRESMKKNQK